MDRKSLVKFLVLLHITGKAMELNELYKNRKLI